MPVTPRDASTVVLTRPGAAGLEVLLTQRPPSMNFAAGLHVFPGGAVDAGDLNPALAGRSALPAGAAAAALGSEKSAAHCLAYYLAAVRELFEEAGILLAEHAGGAPLAVSEAALSSRAAVAGGTLGWIEFCERFDLRLRCDLLVYLARWITPASMPRRFDTRFFAAPLPPGQQPQPDPGEVEHLAWMTPRAALEALRRGQIQMWLPTSTTLHHLADAREFEEIRISLASGPPGSIVSETVSPLVRRVVAPNPGLLTGPGTNAYIVGSGEVAVIDPALQDEPFLEALEEPVRAGRGRIACVLLTHVHPDHVGGSEELADRHGAPVLCGPGGAGLLPFPARELAEGEKIRVGGATLTVVHAPGHAPEHLCFLLEEERALFSGDVIVGEGTVMITPPEGDMARYMRSLRRLQALALRRIYPGHHAVIDQPDLKLAALIAHREQRTRKVLGALSRGPRPIEDLLREVYADVAPPLLPLARGSLEAILLMLEQDGSARREGERWLASR